MTRIRLLPRRRHVLAHHLLHHRPVARVPGDAGGGLGRPDHGGLGVRRAEDEVAEEGDLEPAHLDDGRLPRLGQRAAGAEVRDARRVERGDGVHDAVRPVVHEVVVGERDGPDARVDQDGHARRPCAEVEVLGNRCATRGERALEVDHHQVRPGEERLHLREAPAVHRRAALSLGAEPVHPLLVVRAEGDVSARDERDGPGRWRFGRRRGWRGGQRWLLASLDLRADGGPRGARGDEAQRADEGESV